MSFLMLLGCALFAASPVSAQGGPRPLDAPAAAAWGHAGSGLVLPASPLGLTRTKLQDSTSDELDVLAEYKDGADGLTATVYIYRTLRPDASLWFDRALETVRLLPLWGLAGTARPDVNPFTPPGDGAASGLRAVMPVTAAGQRATGLAVAPLGDFLVKVRMSSTQIDAPALASKLDAFVAALRWPARTQPERPAAPILDCAAPLKLKPAREVRTRDMEQNLLGGLFGLVASRPSATRAAYCREPGATLQAGVYRPGGAQNAYLVALGDAGIALEAAQAISLDQLTSKGRDAGGRRGSGQATVTLLDRTSAGVLATFNRLPTPQQALAAAMRGPPMVRAEAR